MIRSADPPVTGTLFASNSRAIALLTAALNAGSSSKAVAEAVRSGLFVSTNRADWYPRLVPLAFSTVGAQEQMVKTTIAREESFEIFTACLNSDPLGKSTAKAPFSYE